MELAIINGTYRSSTQQNAVVAAQIAAAKQNGLAALREFVFEICDRVCEL